MATDDQLDRIHIRDLLLRCIVGIYDHERTQKQDVMINITLYADLARPCRTDDIDDTVNYKTIKKQIIEEVENSSYFLVERLAQRIADICLTDERVLKAKVLVEKPAALRFARTVGIEIVRERPS